MSKIQVICVDGFKCEATNEQGQTISTDAPREIGGEGNAFSPTDMLAASICTCMMTMMAFSAKRAGISLSGMTAEVKKEMTGGTKSKLKKIDVAFNMPAGIPKERKVALENAANACPVYNSLHPDIEHAIKFQYQE